MIVSQSSKANANLVIGIKSVEIIFLLEQNSFDYVLETSKSISTRIDAVIKDV